MIPSDDLTGLSHDLKQIFAGGQVASRDLRAVKARFTLGLVGLVAVTLFGSLAIMALLPSLAPGWRSSVLTTDSMRPSIAAGDVVILKDHNGIGLGPSSVVLFEDPAGGSPITHRIVALRDDGSYVTKGDANARPDSSPVFQEDIVAVGRFVVPLVGLPKALADQGRWFLLVTLVVVGVVAVRLSAFAMLDEYDPDLIALRLAEAESESEAEAPVGVPVDPYEVSVWKAGRSSGRARSERSESDR
ncbi:MAG: signal peptidase I [Acidimicrobiia bacterium]